MLDVKVGEGAFMEDLESATGCSSHAMMRLGDAAGLPTTCMLSSMDEPLGCAVGNALEVAEAVATLEGRGPADLTELCLVAAGLMLGDRGPAEEALRSGRALAAYREWIAAQGGDPDAELPRAPVVAEVRADRSGTVERCGSRAIADAAMRLGAGRARKEDAVDHAVGIVVHRKRGDRSRPATCSRQSTPAARSTRTPFVPASSSRTRPSSPSPSCSRCSAQRR